ncbi:MAG: flavin-dependent oxidoreductase [Planctomycetota bacterium]|nr:MAG: flavin-dependent oxidoreductase [Planctomycetota bacterium]
MEYDIFFSISQTPVGNRLPSEAEMFGNFFDQVQAADRLGFGVAWIAESHLSSEIQKRHPKPVIPHWQGEVGLNVDFLQLCHQVFAQTKHIEMGSAVMNILVNGGPVAAAERIAAFCALHGLSPQEKRRIHLGFSQGRFEFMNRASGILPRDEVEQAAWPALRGKVFAEACEIFLRLLRGDVLASSDVAETTLSAEHFRSEAEWSQVQQEAEKAGRLSPDRNSVSFARRWDFEVLKIVPQEWSRELVNLVIGSHDSELQEKVNQILPVQVFNLSITQPDVIEETHRRMTQAYHPDGGPWKRSYMPRTVFVFLNEEEGLSSEQRSQAARNEAETALQAYWTALEGTLDPRKVSNAADNALIGNAEQVAEQIRQRFHPEDRVMLWFDFFNHDSARVIRNMEAFMHKVVPRLPGSALSTGAG